MNKIITISREFGSGGRELGKRLADRMNIPCYDQEIIEEVAKLRGLAPEHIERISEADIRMVYPQTIGHRFAAVRPVSDNSIKVAAAQKEVILRLARQCDCVLVGRGADIIPQEEKPSIAIVIFFIFSSSDLSAKDTFILKISHAFPL